MPEKLKHKCPNCHLNKWIIDYREGCATELTHNSICLFCQQAKEIDKVKKENLELKNHIKELFAAIKELRMSNQNLNEEVIENGKDIHDIRTKLASRTSNNIGARPKEEIINVGNTREEPFIKVTGRSLANRKPRHQARLETPTSNRFSLLSEVEEESVLIGDSTVKDQGKHFSSGNQRKRHVQSYPGAKSKDLKEVVGKLKTKSRKSIILVQASGNDLFQEHGCVGETEPVVKQLKSTVEAVKEKTDNGIIIGLLPRRNVSHYAQSKAIGINNRLHQICKQNGVSFLNLWEKFIENGKMYQRDGTHFNDKGKKAFGNLLNEKVRNLLQNATHREYISGPNSAIQIAADETPETKNQGNMQSH